MLAWDAAGAGTRVHVSDGVYQEGICRGAFEDYILSTSGWPYALQTMHQPKGTVSRSRQDQPAQLAASLLACLISRPLGGSG